MRISVEEITERVCELLDENREILDQRVEYADPGMALAPLVERLLPEASRIVLSTLPLASIDECLHLGGKVQTFSCQDYSYLTLPDDFLRLVYLRMSDWNDGIMSLLVYGEPSQRLRLRRMGGRRFGRVRPAAAVRCRGDLKELVVYGSSPGAECVALDYVPVPRIKENAIDLPPRALHEVCVRISEMVGDILGDRAWK